MDSSRTLLNLATQLAKQQEANCNKIRIMTTGGNQKPELATKEDIREIKMKLDSLQQSCGRDICSTFHPRDCYDILLTGNRESKVYTIYPKEGSRFQVYCDQETDGGGWTVIQRRQDGSEDFFRTWKDYKSGFGNLSNEFWLGNDKIHTMTESGKYTLRIDMKDFSGNFRHAIYNTFIVGNEKSGYLLTVSGYSGDAGDSLSYHNNVAFVSKDRDNEKTCAKRFKGGWWYKTCHQSNLNGLYLKGNHTSFANGVNWLDWKGYNYSLKFADMKIRKTSV
ncbi:ryncolin-4-like [Saccostrea echinata]|uniref:ryncolin-4-like n=1 Tax=Saccostrea echinata TaxID=191078 RepID=UPI002A7ED1EB|nr:ryncolin-4-like [Saccostrea echinata]